MWTSALTVQWVAIAASGIALSRYVPPLVLLYRRPNIALRTPRGAYEANLNEAIRLGFSGSGDFLKEAKDYDTLTRDAYRYLDSRAAAVLGFVGGGVSLVAIAHGSDKLPLPVITPDLVGAIVALIGVFAGCIACMMIRARTIPDAYLLTDRASLMAVGPSDKPDGAAALALLAWEYLSTANQTANTIPKRIAALNFAQLLFAVGVFLLVINAIARP